VDSGSTARIHWSFWAIGAAGLIWNALSAVNFFVQMNPEMLAAYRESERLIVESRPAWATGTFALAVFAGTFGCAALLLRRSAAFILLLASFVGVMGR
jgi:hypothetical protein